MTGNDSSADSSDEAVTPDDPTDVRFVGPATASVLADAAFDAGDILDKTVSYEMLTDAGVNPGVAARLRREHSLSWSFDGSDGDDLANRSEQVRGLQEDERAWVAASSGDWESASADAASTDGSGETEAAEAAWRDRSRPDPVTHVRGVDDDAAALLSEAGITSVRSLAVADPEHVADSLSLDQDRVTEWRDAARERI